MKKTWLLEILKNFSDSENFKLFQAFKAWAMVKTEEAKVVFKELMTACDKSLTDPGCVLTEEAENEDPTDPSIPWSKGLKSAFCYTSTIHYWPYDLFGPEAKVSPIKIPNGWINLFRFLMKVRNDCFFFILKTWDRQIQFRKLLDTRINND